MTSEDIKHHLIITKHVEKRSKESDKMKKNEDGKQAEAEDDEVMPPRKATPVVVRTSSDRLLHLAGVRLPAVWHRLWRRQGGQRMEPKPRLKLC